MATIRHGTISGYANGCTADCCMTAWREYHREYRKMRREREIRADQHGKVGTYANAGCRCLACRNAKAKSRRRHVVG